MFDATQFAPGEGFELWPAGTIPVVIRKSEEKPIKDDKGILRQFTIEALEGPMKGKTTLLRLNLKHKDPQTMERACRDFSAICWVCNTPRIQNFDQVNNIPFYLTVTVTKGEYEGRTTEQNNFTDFRNVQGVKASELFKQAMGQGGAPAPAPQQFQPPQQQAQPAQPAAPQGWPQPGAQPAPAQPPFAPQPGPGGVGQVWTQPPAQPPQPPQQAPQTWPAGGAPAQPAQPQQQQPAQGWPQQQPQPQPGAAQPAAGSIPWQT